MPVSERHRYLFDDLTAAKEYIDRDRPEFAKIRINEAINKLAKMEYDFQVRRAGQKKRLRLVKPVESKFSS